MEGLYIGKGKEKYIEKTRQKSAILKLIAHGDGTEIMIQEIAPGKVFGVAPAEDADTLEFFYVLKGSIIYNDQGEKIVIKQNDFFYTHHLQKVVNFETIEQTVLLYVTSQPLFHFISDNIEKLRAILARVEKKDRYTHNHGKRVEDFSIQIANKLGLTGDSYRSLCFAALFHDIGKINVPDKILKKPALLSTKEYDIVKRHPLEGEKMVKGTFIENIGKIIKQHHERLDGSGYPEGLKGEDILLEARIIGITDSFDAMVSDRPYRKGMKRSKAIQELKQLAGIKYDEKIIDIFIGILKEKKGASCL